MGGYYQEHSIRPPHLDRNVEGRVRDHWRSKVGKNQPDVKGTDRQMKHGSGLLSIGKKKKFAAIGKTKMELRRTGDRARISETGRVSVKPTRASKRGPKSRYVQGVLSPSFTALQRPAVKLQCREYQQWEECSERAGLDSLCIRVACPIVHRTSQKEGGAFIRRRNRSRGRGDGKRHMTEGREQRGNGERERTRTVQHSERDQHGKGKKKIGRQNTSHDTGSIDHQ